MTDSLYATAATLSPWETQALLAFALTLAILGALLIERDGLVRLFHAIDSLGQRGVAAT